MRNFFRGPSTYEQGITVLGQMSAGDNGESSYRFQFNPGDWYQQERQHDIHRLQHNDFIDVFEHCSFHGLLTWSGAKANLLNVFYRKNTTSLFWVRKKPQTNSSCLGGFLISACMPSEDRMNSIKFHITGFMKQSGTCGQRYFYLL